MNRSSIIAISLLMTFLLGLGVGWFWWGMPLDEAKKSLKEASAASDRKSITKEKRVLKDFANSKPKDRGQIKKENSSKASAAVALEQENKPQETPRAAKDLLHHILSELENSKEEKVDVSKFWGRLQQLKDFGEEGSQAILEFFQTNEDISLGPNSNWASMGGRNLHLTSLRTSLLEVLCDMKDPIAQTASLEVLQTTSSPQEILLAARNLEKFSPGTYRAEALLALQETLANLSEKFNPRTAWQDFQVFEIAGYYQAREFIPQMEDFIKKQPEALGNGLNAVLKFPLEDQVSVLERLAADGNLRKQIAANSFFLVQLDYGNDRLRQITGELFKEMDPKQKTSLIQLLGNSAHTTYSMGFNIMESVRPANFFSRPTYQKKSGIEASLKLFDELEPSADTPALKVYLDEARQKFQEALAKAKE